MRFLRGSVLTLLAFIPTVALAISLQEALPVKDGDPVTRIEFLRGAITMFNIDLVTTKRMVPVSRKLPAVVHPYVWTADAKNVLTVFQDAQLDLLKPITRGEALLVILELKDLHPTGAPKNVYADLPRGSRFLGAVRYALEQQWMEATGIATFGVRETLLGKEAKLLLARASGQSQIPLSQLRKTAKTLDQGRATLDTQMIDSVWKMLRERSIYTEKLDGQEASYRAAEAMVQMLNDPYTTFMRPQASEAYQSQLSGEITGIGAQVELENGIVTVVTPLPGTPAEKAGVLPGDHILTVDGVDVSKMSLMDAVARIRGPVGTTVVLGIQRNGGLLDIAVKREVIKIAEIEITLQGEIAIVKLIQFGETTDRDLRKLLADLIAKDHVQGMVLDLRSNPGGLLDAAVTVVSNFVPKGTVVAHINTRSGDEFVATDLAPTVPKTMPLVVLVNNGSASASEIVAGALQDASRAKVVGTVTYGKGTVQQILEFKNGASLKLTIAEWMTPNNRKINAIGITPDEIVESVDGRDSQLLRALELLR